MIAWAEQCFREADLCYGHGTDNPADEAAYLVLRGLDLSMDTDAAGLDTVLPDVTLRRLTSLVEQRISARTPVAYLVNEAWFYGMPFYVDEQVHIPRSPLAELIDIGFSPWLAAAEVTNILDMCTGSGCIAVACACAFPGASIDAVDSSTEALAVASRNVAHYQLSDRIRLIHSDLYRELGDRHYDLILANPPYVGTHELSTLPREYHHEPVASLHAGQNGLDIVRRLLADSKQYLSQHGVLVVEVGNSQQAVMETFVDLPFTWLNFEHGGDGVFLLTADQL